MRTAKLVLITAVILAASQAHAVVLAFDDVPLYPPSALSEYYQPTYGIVFASGFGVADHSESIWGPPRSGDNVLVGLGGAVEFAFKWGVHPVLYPPYALSVGGYFSTESGVVVEMIAYHRNTHEGPVASAMIGAPAESWNNVYVQIVGSPNPIGFVRFRPVTDGALSHFSADDLTMEFVPEPSSLAALALALAMGAAARRSGRRRR